MNTTLVAGTTLMGRMDRSFLPEVLFPPPPVIPTPQPTIDQQVAAAQARLRVFIQAECDWLSLHIAKEFRDLRSQSRAIIGYRIYDGAFHYLGEVDAQLKRWRTDNSTWEDLL